MTIKEIESRSGMTRANIRFYEQEGLLSPARAANGYRDYSEDDLVTLERIQLLRTVGMSIPEILSLQRGETELTEQLAHKIADFEALRESAAHAQELCRAMRADRVRYETLDAHKYLSMSLPANGLVSKTDVREHLKCPWRRFFARWFDFMLYQLPMDLLLLIGFRLRPDSAVFGIVPFCALAVMLFVEPMLLMRFGTTPGKALLGLYIEDENGARPTYKEARERVALVIVRGMGVCIPVYQLVRLYKSWRCCTDGEPLYWDWPLVLYLKDNKNWRTAAYTAAVVVWAFVLALGAALSATPPNASDAGMTVAEFAENFNTLAKHYGVLESRYLDENGVWQQYTQPSGTISVEIGSAPDTDFVYELEDGCITAVSFTSEMGPEDGWLYSCDNTMIVAVLAYAGAELSPFSGERSRVPERIYENSFEDFSFEVGNVSVSCEVEYSGYTKLDDILLPNEDTKNEFYMHFRMEKKG